MLSGDEEINPMLKIVLAKRSQIMQENQRNRFQAVTKTGIADEHFELRSIQRKSRPDA